MLGRRLARRSARLSAPTEPSPGASGIANFRPRRPTEPLFRAVRRHPPTLDATARQLRGGRGSDPEQGSPTGPTLGQGSRVRFRSRPVAQRASAAFAFWSADVTGFGCRPIANVAAHTGAGVRKPPGKEGAGCGAPGSAGAMGIWLAPSVQRRRYAAGSAAADEHRHPFPAQTGIKSALVQGVARPLP